MVSAGPTRRRSTGLGAVLLGVTAVAIAGALPVAALTVATRSATNDVEDAVFAGATATATAVGNQAGHEYESAVDTLVRARTGPTLLNAYRSPDSSELQGLPARFLAAGPYDTLAAYDANGRMLSAAPGSSGPPPPFPDPAPDGVEEGPLVPAGAQTVRRLTVPVDDLTTGARLGYVVADIDLSRLVEDASALRFGRTGVSKLVGTDGRVLSSPDGDAGTSLLAPENQRLARAHRPATTTIFAPFYGRRTVEAYVPVEGQPFGVLTQQAEQEAFADVRDLSRRLRDLRVVFALLGLALGAGVATVVLRRDRRIRSQTADLAAAKELFRSAFDDAPTGAALVGLDGHYLAVNAALCDLTGYTSEELLGRTIDDLTHPDDHAATADLTARIAADDLDGFDLEKRYVRSDGEVRWVNVRASAVHDERGRVTHTIRHIVDVTERRQAADALRSALEREQRAAEELRRLDAVRTDLLLTVSHDFKSPLYTISGYASMLVEDWARLDDAQRVAMLEAIARNCGELDRRVKVFLEYSRLDNVDVELDFRHCDLPVAIQAAVERCRSFLEDHHTITSFPTGATAWADPEALERVLENLISNAGKYSPAGTTVTIGARVEGDEVVVHVDDEGPGIPPDHAARIFDRFYRVSSGEAAPSGTGIGLTAVHQLVTSMNGRVWLEPRPTGGTSFRFSLPCSPPDEGPVVTLPDEAAAS